MTNILKPTEWLNELDQIKSECKQIAMHYFQNNPKIEQKVDKTVVTQADLEIETMVRDTMIKKFPELAIYGEEFGACDKDAPLKLIIDPIDGTYNYARGIPVFATLLAIEKEGEIVAGLVHNPATNETWSAAKGNGATYNGKPIEVSSISSLDQAQLVFCSLFGPEAPKDSSRLIELAAKTHRQRSVGDFLIQMWVAQGYGEIGYDVNLKPWDLAPMGVIITEAGGKISQVNGQPFDVYESTILTSNGLIHDEVVSVLNQ
jgi:histidinol phosphatase-like enzyme (inositol monophosphatase family)